MPFHELAVVPVDVDGAALGLALNSPPPTPLARAELTHPMGGTLVLGVLGASHVITAEHSGTRFSEEVSCLAARTGGTLPGLVEAPGYRMNSQVQHLDSAAFVDLAARLRQQCTRPGWLGGRFPGDDSALTVLCAQAQDTGWAWRTWHLYPDARGGSAVHTTSRWQR